MLQKKSCSAAVQPTGAIATRLVGLPAAIPSAGYLAPSEQCDIGG
jgi:hypothetical protein